MTLALTSGAVGELAVSARGPRHPWRATLAAVGARQVDTAARAAGCGVLALVHIYRQPEDGSGGHSLPRAPTRFPSQQARASPISSGLRHCRWAGLYSAGGVQAQR